MFLLLLLLLPLQVFAAGVRVEFDPRTPLVGPFPTDFLTSEGRVNLPLPDCATRASDCGEIRLINELDGFSPNGRVTVKFSGPVNPETLRSGIRILWLDEDGRVTSLNQLVYDPASNTAYGKPDEMLLGSSRYLVVVTSAVRDRAGDPVESDFGYQACLDRRVGGDYCARLSAAVAGAGAVGRIVSASLFTTLNTTKWYDEASAVVDRTPPGFERQREVVDVARVRSVTFRQQVALSGSDRFEDFTLPLPASLLTQFGVGRVAFASFRSLRQEQIYFHVWLPRQAAPPDGYPVILAGHGFGDSRFGIPTVLSAAASAGYAVVAMTAVGHGSGPESSLRLGLTDGSTLEIPSPGRGVDLTGDGRIGESEGCMVILPGAPLGMRDCLRQTAVDYLQLIHAIRDGMDLDGDGRADLNPRAMSYMGMSLGSFYGTIVTALAPEISAAVLNVGGGFILETARLSPGSRSSIFSAALGNRQPVLLNKGLEFDEDLPLRNEPVRIRSVPGAAELQDFIERAEWIESPSAPAVIAPHLKQRPLPGAAAKRILFQIALGDRTVPNPSNSTLIRAAGLREQTSLYRADRARAVVPGLPENPHVFLSPLGPPQAAIISLAALQQALTFLAGGQETVPDANGLVRELFGQDLFEVPAELPEKMNF
ncbi:MAG: Ig-like domain-containing protein [Bryobacteraceae bacterium]|nr:Ig-like domain-containing protein [Bryobacteraceae bacterium]